MYLFGVLCLLALPPSILAAGPPRALQQRDPANVPRQFLEYDGKDFKDPVPSKDSDKDKDKPANLTSTVTPSFAPTVIPSKDLPSSTSIGSDKDKSKDDKTSTAASTSSFAPTVTPSKDLPSSTTIESDKDKTKDDKTYQACSTPSLATVVVPSKDLPSSTTIGSDKDKDKDDKTSTTLSTPLGFPSQDLPSSTTMNSDKDKGKDDKSSTAASTPSFTPIGLPSKNLPSLTTANSDTDKSNDNQTYSAASTPIFPTSPPALTSDKEKDKDSSTTPLKDKTSSMKPSKDMSSNIESLTITNLASLTLSFISPATTLPNSTNTEHSSALLTPPMIMYTVTLKPEKPSSTLSLSKAKLSSTGTGLPLSEASGNFSNSPSLTSGFGSTTFPGYSIVPSPSESGTKADKGSLTNLSSATIPVWTQPMLGNAYGGGFVTTPSIFVTRLPFPSGPPGNVPPGYGIPSKSESSTPTTAAPGNQTSAVIPVNSSILPGGSTEAVKTTSPPYQNATGVSGNVPSDSAFVSVSSQPVKPEGPGGVTSSITLSLVPTASKSEGAKPVLASSPSSPSSQSAVLYSTSFGFKSQSTISGEESSPSSVQSDKSVPTSEGIGGKPEASESKGFDTQSSPNAASGELPTASSAAALQSSQLGLAYNTPPLVPSASVSPGSTRPPLSTPSLASSFTTQSPGSFQQSSASPSIASSLTELASTTLSFLPTPSFASSLGTLEGQNIPVVAKPSLGETVGGSVLQVQTTSIESNLGGHLGGATPLIPTLSIKTNLGNGVAGTTLPSSPTPSLASSLGTELTGTTLPLVPTPSFASTLAKDNPGTTQPLVAAPGPASTLGNEASGTISPVASNSGELGGTSLPLMQTPSLVSTLGNQPGGATVPIVPTPSLVSSLGELAGTSLPFMSTSSVGNELGGTTLPFVSSTSFLFTLASELAEATQPLVPTPSFAISSGELDDKSAPISSASASALAGVKPEGPASVTTKTGEGVGADSTFASTLAGLKPEGPGSVPTVSGNEVAAGSTLISALAGLKPGGPTSAPTSTGKEFAAESTSTSPLACVKPEGPTSIPTESGNEVAADSTTTSTLAGLMSEGSGLVPTVSGKDVAVGSTSSAAIQPESSMSVPTVSGKDVAAGSTSSAAIESEGFMSVPTVTGKEVTTGLTATPTEESGSTSKASVSLSSGEKPKQATEGVVPSAFNTATAQQSASTLSDSAMGGGDSKSHTSLPLGGEASTGPPFVFSSTPSLYMMGGVTGLTPNPAAESSIVNSTIGTSGYVFGTVGPQSNASIAFNVTPTAIQYFEGSAAHVTWSLGGTLITFLALLLWL